MNSPEFRYDDQMLMDSPDELMTVDDLSESLRDKHLFFDSLEDRMITQFGNAERMQIVEKRLEFGWFVSQVVINNVIERVGFFTDHNPRSSRYTTVLQAFHNPQTMAYRNSGYAIDTSIFVTEYAAYEQLSDFSYTRLIDCFTPDNRPLPRFPREYAVHDTIGDLEKEIIVNADKDMVGVTRFKMNDFMRLLNTLNCAVASA